MKKIFALTALLSLFACTAKDPVYWFNPGTSDNNPSSHIPYYPGKPGGGNAGNLTGGYAPAGYNLVWHDEFNSSNLYSNWEFEEGGHGWGNEEIQYYCPGGFWQNTQQRTAYASDGTLKITAYKLPRAIVDGDNTCDYISARMNTKASWTHGYIEMRAKLPLAGGCWSAFWMLLKDGPSYVMNTPEPGAEIDIMEHVPNDDPGKIYFSAHSYNATQAATHNGGKQSGYVHPVSGKKYSYCQWNTVEDAGAWHVYGMEWNHLYIKGFIDGVPYFYVPNPTPDRTDLFTWPFDQAFYLKLNLAIGGSWGGTPAAGADGATYEIDWVRVYQTNQAPVDSPIIGINLIDSLSAHPWVLTGVKENNVSVTTAVGNKITFKYDHTLVFDCTACEGLTFDHTWEGTWISPAAYGSIADMSWYTYVDDGQEYLGICNGYPLVFAQEGTEESVYEIAILTDTDLVITITTYEEVWTLTFEAA